MWHVRRAGLVVLLLAGCASQPRAPEPPAVTGPMAALAWLAGDWLVTYEVVGNGEPAPPGTTAPQTSRVGGEGRWVVADHAVDLPSGPYVVHTVAWMARDGTPRAFAVNNYGAVTYRGEMVSRNEVRFETRLGTDVLQRVGYRREGDAVLFTVHHSDDAGATWALQNRSRWTPR